MGIAAAVFFVVGYHPRTRPHLAIKPMRGKWSDRCAMFIASAVALVFIIGVVRLCIELL
jgi:hypothetical protein